MWRSGCVFGAWKNALGPLCSVETCVCFGSLEERTGALPGRTRWVLSAVWKPVCVLGTFKNALGPLFGFEGSTLSGPRIQSNPSDVNSCISSFASVAQQGFGYNVNIEAYVITTTLPQHSCFSYYAIYRQSLVLIVNKTFVLRP